MILNLYLLKTLGNQIYNRISGIVEINSMDNCFIDIALEFLAVAFHNILYYTAVYPPSVFETKKKYNIVVYRSIHPEINQYIDLCLKNISECLNSGLLNRIEFAITDNEYKPLSKFVFDFFRNEKFDETSDAYLIQSEQNLRAFCLKLSSISHKLQDLPEDRSFSIFLHTNESTAVAIATNPESEEFPFIEVEEKYEETDKILPLRSFALRSHRLDVFVELSK